MKHARNYAMAFLAAVSFWGCKEELTLSEPGALVPMTVGQDPTLPAIAVNGTLLHSEAFGDPSDPMVVFLHGGPGGDYRNGLNAKRLVDNNYYVVFYDQRGSGLSQRHSKDSYTIEVMFEDLDEVIAHYRSSNEQKVFLFGHSWGAMLATGYINTRPAAIDGAILAEAGGFTWEEVQEYGERSRRLKLFSEVSNDVLYPDQFLTGDENDHAVLDFKLALASPYVYGKGNAEGIEGPSPFWRNGTKVLMLYSENNKAFGEAIALQEASAYPHAEIAEVKGTGHEMIYFGWDNVYSLVLPYLNSLR
jgi:proline iminopeptidase